MVNTNSIAKFGRYSSGVLALVFLLNLLLDSQAIPFVDWSPFFGGVEQFLLLLAASALISLEFIIADLDSESQSSQEPEKADSAESHVDVSVES